MIISGAEAKHAATVNRTRVGERIAVGNGRGLLASGVVSAVAPAEVAVTIDRVELRPAPERQIVLVQALAKGGRDELAVQAATELGVDVVMPWQASRSVSRWEGPAKVAKGVQRWQGIAREAAKQSIRPWTPAVSDPIALKELVALTAAEADTVLVLEPSAEIALSTIDLSAPAYGRGRVVLVVGPEGGIADHELASLGDAGATTTRLGAEVLRTSTAGPAALAALNVGLGRW